MSFSNTSLGTSRDDELATEVAWVVVYLTALSNVATTILAKSDLVQVLVEILDVSTSLQLLIPVTCILTYSVK